MLLCILGIRLCNAQNSQHAHKYQCLPTFQRVNSTSYICINLGKTQ